METARALNVFTNPIFVMLLRVSFPSLVYFSSKMSVYFTTPFHTNSSHRQVSYHIFQELTLSASEFCSITFPTGSIAVLLEPIFHCGIGFVHWFPAQIQGTFVPGLLGSEVIKLLAL